MTDPDDPYAEFRPSVQIRSLHNLIGRYLNVTATPDIQSLSGGNMQIIVFLDHHADEDIFQYDIERRFSITRSTASRVLGLMEKKGLVERRSVERDARLRKITLTDKARAIAQELHDNANRMEEVLLAGLDADARRRLCETLDRMKHNLLDTGLIGSECSATHDRETAEVTAASNESTEESSRES
ncbi:MarR family winged helix-turn-helix transcriptional regulator [Bifidobacterium choloepi]|uniref:MarR family transcriptional regulator n=1 Tax=Bifidobacterium choloepi TaxID=2614131 RepID=A0A6I5NP13_9BIFI|nr:MarR family transcriptional regulator [Bifidobacterium choloepi]NEG70442.1 MarR family transcriptional regulator [Bifidobacterium choloepi]